MSAMQTKNIVIVSDIHLRDTPPKFRADSDFYTIQKNKLRFIEKIRQKHKAIVVHGGDLFHHHKPSSYLLSLAYSHLPKYFYTVLGQHDLPNNSFTEKQKSPVYLLEQTGKLNIIPFSWKEDITECSFVCNDINVLVAHKFVYKNKEHWMDKDSSAFVFVNKHKNADLIVTGDNHVPFVCKKGKRFLVNPGSMTRQKTSERHKPRIYVFDTEAKELKKFYIPIKPLEIQNETKQTIEFSFIKEVSELTDETLTFEKIFEEQLNQIPLFYRDLGLNMP